MMHQFHYRGYLWRYFIICYFVIHIYFWMILNFENVNCVLVSFKWFSDNSCFIIRITLFILTSLATSAHENSVWLMLYFSVCTHTVLFSKFLIFRKSHVWENGEISRNSRGVLILSELVYTRSKCLSVAKIDKIKRITRVIPFGHKLRYQKPP